MLSNNVQSKVTFLGLLRRWFLAGLLATVPIGFTVYITWLLVSTIDGYIAMLLPGNLNPQNYLPYYIPGIGLVLGILVIIFIGWVTANFLGRGLVRFGESLLARVPVVRSVYGAVKQIMETVTTSQSDAFREVVLVEYPRRGIWAIGFVTGTTRGEVQNMSKEDLINVFVPTTPNPTSGFLLFFPRNETIKLDMGVEEAVKMVVSGGIVTPEDPRAENREAASLADAAPKNAKKTKAKKKKVAQQVKAKTVVSQKKSPKKSANKAVPKGEAKQAAQKTTTKKVATKKVAAKKVAAKKVVAKKNVASKAAPKQTVKKQTVKKQAGKKQAGKKQAAKKS